MKKITFKFITLLLAGTVIILSCGKGFLEKTPKGSLDVNALANKKGVEALLVGSYAVLDGFINGGGIFLGGWQSSGTNWVYGSICGGDAHKGTDAGDQPDINPIETFAPTATNGYFDTKWRIVYEGINRSNGVLKVMASATDISATDKTRIEGEARFLRGHYHFEAKKMWNKVPYYDETITDYNQPNDADIWPKIEADLQFAYANLPVTMNAKGRVNKYAAGALLAKCLLFQGKYAQAKTVLQDVVTNGTNAQGQRYALLTKYSDNFNADTKNSTESVFAVQYSVNDGSNADNGGWGEVLNFPYTGGPGTCCGFFQPSQDLVNSFKTDAVTGLPDPDNYNNVIVTNDAGILSTSPFTPYAGTLDARLDWTVGRRGIPYLDWGKHPGYNWIRDQTYGGPYSPIKNTYYRAQERVKTDINFWTSGITANNYTLIRFADVLLWLAEAEVEAGSLEAARGLVNQVRARAANPAGWVMDGASPAANYKIGLYNTPWTVQANARKAVRFERKLELGMEGHRFFDLVRWGAAAAEVNRMLDYNGGVSHPSINNKRGYMASANFTANKNEYFPIPQSQIDRSVTGGVAKLKQNPGY
ncbi:MAG: RagB/SusD family nutrient uptake outer membrane protein [Bacteroidetes bacterium]|nr:RagB/SusD family nutrient uptake outer membrane protein [Bacteroidota bacterium]